MRRIAVLSDTHNSLPEGVAGRLVGADEIWHLGDVCEEACLVSLHALKKPFHLVRGNCDSNLNWPYVIDFEREGFLIRLIHIPPREAPPGIDLLFHGHTHVPRNERVGNARFFNPGAVGKANKGAPRSFAWLELTRGKPPGWEVILL